MRFHVSYRAITLSNHCVYWKLAKSWLETIQEKEPLSYSFFPTTELWQLKWLHLTIKKKIKWLHPWKLDMIKKIVQMPVGHPGVKVQREFTNVLI